MPRIISLILSIEAPVDFCIPFGETIDDAVLKVFQHALSCLFNHGTATVGPAVSALALNHRSLQPLPFTSSDR